MSDTQRNVQRCTECGTRSSKRTYHHAKRKGGGNYRRPSRWYDTTICDQCARDTVGYYLETMAANRGIVGHSPGTNLSYHSCFRTLGIDQPRSPEEAQALLDRSTTYRRNRSIDVLDEIQCDGCGTRTKDRPFRHRVPLDVHTMRGRSGERPICDGTWRKMLLGGAA